MPGRRLDTLIARTRRGRRLSPAGALILLSLVLLVACGEPLATPEPVFLRAVGSTSLSPLVADLARAFGEQSPNIELEVTGLGTGFGLQALRAGECEIALASWLPPDLDQTWRTTAIARDGLAIIVHPSNPIEELGLLQLQDLFGGRAYEWLSVGGQRRQGPVQPLSREEGSGSRAAFEALVMEDQPLTPLAVVLPSSQAVVDYVAQNAGAIGYVSLGYLSPEVKVVKIEGALPTPQTTGQGVYPLTRELWLVTAAAGPEAVQLFVDFVLSPAGQQLVGQRYGRIK